MPISFAFGLRSIGVRPSVLAVLFLAWLFLPQPSSAQMTLTGSVSPKPVSYIGTLTYSASASGGDPATRQYAYFRRRPGGTWIPSIDSPNWTSSTTFTWRPTSSDIGTWETYIWVKDGNTPPTQNTYGYAAGYNTMPVDVIGPPTVPGPTTVNCAYAPSGQCWMTGDFTISVSASSGGLGSISYQICRSNDTTGWGGCDVNLTLNGGTSTTVSGSHLPADGYQRAYYFQARDSAGAYSGWNSPKFVKVDRYAPSVSATNASGTIWSSYRTATVSASDSGSGLQSVRYGWNSPHNSSCTSGTSTNSGATLVAPAGDNVLYLCAKDNVGRVNQWSGQYRISPVGLTGSVSPTQGSYLGSFTYTASASGGTASTYRYAFFRRRPGGTWIPDVNAPNWQAGNTFTWQPTSSDTGTWETYIWAKDGDTPSTMNGYGYAAGYNTMPIEVLGPPTVPGPTTTTCAYTASGECWVQGDFTASVTASTGGSGSLVYQICRSNDTAGFGGCDVNLTLNGGTSILVSGTHLPVDGYRRAYYFQARDSSGANSGWNTPLYVRVDRYAPSVSASNASATEWFYSRTAVVAASDGHSGVQSVRYSWNAALDAACTTGTATSSGASLSAPAGENTLYLCARDNTGRVAQWSGRYRIANSLSLTACSVSPAQGSYTGGFTWSAAASGGIPSTTRFAYFRRRPGGTWIPDVNAPTWLASNTWTWNPASSDAGTWETYVWVKDGNTPATQNGYGYAAGCNPGPITVIGPPTVPGPTTVSCNYTSGEDCWVQGDVTASVTASTGGSGTLVYQICRSNDTSGFGGCDVNLTLTGGTTISVTGTHLPSDGYRRAYYFQAKDSANAYSGWNTPRYVRVDRYAPTLGASNASATFFSHRTAAVTASDGQSGLQGVRYSWNTALDAACTAGTATFNGAVLTAPPADNVLYLCAKDNTGRVAQWNGQYRISPLGLTGTVAPKPASYQESVTYTVTATGGTPATIRYAYFRRRPGAASWIPDVTAPNWQAGNTFSWQPAQADIGTWETYVWVKDGDTPASQNTYGYAAGFNTMPIDIVGAPTVPGPTTVSCAYTTTDDCWVQGDFTASVTASTGGKGSLVYQICRSNDTATTGGCDVNLTLTGTTSILVSGTHLPSDGYRRAYHFQATDAAGVYSGWNTPRYVRVDRAAPTVSASNASDSWFRSRAAVVSASDTGSGLAAVRYSWNTALDASCTTGTVASSGATLTAPSGDNLLYLCARDNTGRVAQWNGRYKVAPSPTITVTPTPAKASYLTTLTWTITVTGGVPGTHQYAFVRKLPDGPWIPDVNTPNWQTGTSFSWKPEESDAGSWTFFFAVKDGLTTPTDNVYGYASGVGSGPVEIAGKPTVPGPTTVACAWESGEDCWITGDTEATVTPSTGGMGSLVYHICRSNDSSGGFAGCEVNLTLAGSAGILLSGSYLPADGFRRSYWFQAKDSAGALSGWNTPRYVRIDRYDPTVSADNASAEWFDSRTATVSAADGTNGTGSNSGLAQVRHSWNTALDAACTTGTVTAPGTTLNVPMGDNLLYLCAKDNTGRVAQWSGQYRVTVVPAPKVTSVSPKVIDQGTTTMLTVYGENLQDATLYIATQPDEGKPAPTNPFPTAELNEISPDGTWLTVIIDASEPGIDGWQNLAINTPGGKTAAQFRVVGEAPVVDVYTPSQPVQGNIHILMLAGVNLMGAEVVPSDPSVKVLDLDNSKDDMLMGLLYVDSDGPVGATEIRVESPGGAAVTLSIEVTESAAAASVTTTAIAIPGRSGLADVPDVLMQTPVTSSSLLPILGYRQPGETGDGSAMRSATGDSISLCAFVSVRERFERTYMLLGLTDLFGNPLTRTVLNKLKPGQRLDFNSLTVAARAFLEFELYFRICQNWTTLAYACVRGEVSYMVPVVGGYRLAFDYCYGTEGPRVQLAAEGFVSKHEWSSTSACVTVDDKTSQETDPESPDYGSGRRRGRIAVDCCTPADVYLHVNAQALGTDYDVQGRAMDVDPENCTNPGPPELRVFLDVDSDNVNADPDYLYEPSELDDSGRYLPCSPLGGTAAPPGAGLPPTQLPQVVPLRAAYVQSYSGKLKIVPPPAGVTSVEINLQNTSKLAGIATNYPIDFTGGPGSTNADPDFWLAASGQTSQEKVDTVSATFDGSLAAVNLLCNDYAGSTSIRARPLPEGTFTTPMPLPATSLGSQLPSIGWTAVSGNPVQATEAVDGDQMPAGTGQTGDGLSVTSEYRGVVIDGKHYRLDPGRKDLFVMWDAAFEDGGTAGLGLQIHRPRPAEVWENSGILVANIHGMSNSLETDMVVAVALVNDTQSPLPPYDPDTPTPLGTTAGTVSMRGAAPVTTTMYTRRISEYRDQYPQRLPLAETINWVYSHEIGHAVDICHREEDGQGNALPDPHCEPGTILDPPATIPNGVFFMHSGAIFQRIGTSTNGRPASSYHVNSLSQIKLK